MGLYPAQLDTKKEKRIQKVKWWKQSITAIVLTVIMAVGWWAWWVMSAWIIQSMGFEYEPKVLINFSIMDWGYWTNGHLWKPMLVGIGIWATLYGFVSLIPLLIKQAWLRAIPVIVGAQVYWLVAPPSLAGLLILTAIVTQFLFILDVINGMGLLKKIAVRKLIVPAAGILMMGMSLMLSLPMYTYLQQDPDSVQTTVEYRLVRPLIEKILSYSANSAKESSATNDNPPKTQEVKPTVSSLLTPEIVTKLQNMWGKDAVDEIINAPQPDFGDITQNISNQIQVPTGIFKEQIASKTMDTLAPVMRFAYIILPLLLMISLWQVSAFVRGWLFLVPWVMWQISRGLKLARITLREETVEVIEI